MKSKLSEIQFPNTVIEQRGPVTQRQEKSQKYLEFVSFFKKITTPDGDRYKFEHSPLNQISANILRFLKQQNIYYSATNTGFSRQDLDYAFTQYDLQQKIIDFHEIKPRKPKQ